MNKMTEHKETGHAAACPYCSAGMYWDFQDGCWLCILCGHREHGPAERLERMIEIGSIPLSRD